MICNIQRNVDSTILIMAGYELHPNSDLMAYRFQPNSILLSGAEYHLPVF